MRSVRCWRHVVSRCPAKPGYAFTRWPTSSPTPPPADVETLTRQVTELEQQILDLRAELAERDEDLTAARAANRELMAQVNR
ncbi:hypothetical protein [Streptomyces sp. NBC_00996]|uniref:hypothetical protein n=1 Tax=Streptomyces sp. NBC_00996 TaxID=2903710 RepID=UPI00387042A5|nr:hypothetical protein OG390_32305 [Streptomyces sp. NBC_00996]